LTYFNHTVSKIYIFKYLSNIQCDQIGRNCAIKATFLLNQFLPKQATSTHNLFEGFKRSLMWMFRAF